MSGLPMYLLLILFSGGQMSSLLMYLLLPLFCRRVDVHCPVYPCIYYSYCDVGGQISSLSMYLLLLLLCRRVDFQSIHVSTTPIVLQEDRCPVYPCIYYSFCSVGGQMSSLSMYLLLQLFCRKVEVRSTQISTTPIVHCRCPVCPCNYYSYCSMEGRFPV